MGGSINGYVLDCKLDPETDVSGANEFSVGERLAASLKYRGK